MHFCTFINQTLCCCPRSLLRSGFLPVYHKFFNLSLQLLVLGLGLFELCLKSKRLVRFPHTVQFVPCFLCCTAVRFTASVVGVVIAVDPFVPHSTLVAFVFLQAFATVLETGVPKMFSFEPHAVAPGSVADDR